MTRREGTRVEARLCGFGGRLPAMIRQYSNAFHRNVSLTVHPSTSCRDHARHVMASACSRSSNPRDRRHRRDGRSDRRRPHAEYVQLEAKRFTAVDCRPSAAHGAAEGARGHRHRPALSRGGRHWAFIVPLSVPECARWDARTVNPDELISCPGAECYAFDPGEPSLRSLPSPTDTRPSRCRRMLRAGSAAAPCVSAQATRCRCSTGCRTCSRRRQLRPHHLPARSARLGAEPLDLEHVFAGGPGRAERGASISSRQVVGRPNPSSAATSAKRCRSRSSRRSPGQRAQPAQRLLRRLHDEPEALLRLWQLIRFGVRCDRRGASRRP